MGPVGTAAVGVGGQLLGGLIQQRGQNKALAAQQYAADQARWAEERRMQQEQQRYEEEKAFRDRRYADYQRRYDAWARTRRGLASRYGIQLGGINRSKLSGGGGRPSPANSGFMKTEMGG